MGFAAQHSRGFTVRVSQHHKAVFVRSVMSNIPTTDFDQQIKDTIINWFAARLPLPVGRLWSDRQLRDWVRLRKFFYKPIGDYVYVPSLDDPKFEPDNATQGTIDALIASDESQTAGRDLMTGQLHALVQNCRTLKQMREMVPEDLHSHLPTDPTPPPNRMVPAIAPDVLLGKLSAMGFVPS